LENTTLIYATGIGLLGSLLIKRRSIHMVISMMFGQQAL